MLRYCVILIATFCSSITVCVQGNVLPDSLQQFLHQITGIGWLYITNYADYIKIDVKASV
jgi:hypothetical protein